MVRFALAFGLMAGLAIPGNILGKPKEDEGVSVRRKIEPRYPAWAYTRGIGEGYAKIAFYVDENGEASDFFPIEYSHEPFAEELMSALLKGKFVPAYREGVPVKSVCHAFWDFLPDRPIETNALYDTAKRIAGAGGEPTRALKYRGDGELDSRIQMLSFPGLAIAHGSGLLEEGIGTVRARLRFFVDLRGRVVLPYVVDSAYPLVDERLLAAFGKASFEVPVYEGEGVIALLERTYDFPVVWLDEEPPREL